MDTIWQFKFVVLNMTSGGNAETSIQVIHIQMKSNRVTLFLLY